MKENRAAELKYEPYFPLEDYLKEHYPDGHINSSGQFVATCPHCGRKDKFYYDLDKKRGLCHRCYAVEDHGAFRTLSGLIAFTENIDYQDALQKLKRYANNDLDEIGRALDLANKSKYRLNNLDNMVEEEDDDLFGGLDIKIDIPKKYKLNPADVKAALHSRARPMPYKITKLFPVWGSGDYKLKNRMIFEIWTNDNYAWLAYAMNKKVFPKTLNPPGSILSSFLGGYNYVKDEKYIIVVEGIFDMFRVLLRGYPAVCSFGNKLSPIQIYLLNESDADEIVLCYDTDLNGAGWKAMWRIIKKYRGLFDKHVSLMFMDYEYKNGTKIGVDPDSVSRANFVKALKERRHIL